MTTIQPNSNPTNSELDAKQIVTHKQLTSDQQNDIIEQYVELIVDNMDTKDLVRYAQEQLTDYFTKLSPIEVKEDIDCYQEDLYYELVDNILTDDIAQQLDTTNPYNLPSRF